MSCDHDMALGTCPECDDYGRSPERQKDEGPIGTAPTPSAAPSPFAKGQAYETASGTARSSGDAAGIAVHPSHLPTVVDLLEDEVAELKARLAACRCEVKL